MHYIITRTLQSLSEVDQCNTLLGQHIVVRDIPHVITNIVSIQVMPYTNGTVAVILLVSITTIEPPAAE